MELYKFFWGALAWIATFAILWPINVPLIALAYKVQNGPKPISIEREEHRAVLGVMPSEQHLIHFPGASFLLLDGKIYHPDRVNLLKLLQVMAATGEVDLNKLE